MTSAALKAARFRPPEADLALVMDLLHQLLEGQQRIVLALERSQGPRDAADQTVLVVTAETIGDRRWTCGQLLEHADLSPALHDALQNADISNARDLGWFCRRVHGSPRSGICLERAGESRDGVLWSVVVRATQ